jgi:hypothetical protein
VESLRTAYETGVGPQAAVLSALEAPRNLLQSTSLRHEPALRLRLAEALWLLNEQLRARREPLADQRCTALAQARVAEVSKADERSVREAFGYADDVVAPYLVGVRATWIDMLADSHLMRTQRVDVDDAVHEMAEVLANSPSSRVNTLQLTTLVLLPRYMLKEVSWLCRPTGKGQRRAVACAPWLPLLGALLFAACLPSLSTAAAYRVGAIPALVSYLVVLWTAAIHPLALLGMCLRLPATTVLGLIGMLSFATGWQGWDHDPIWWLVPPSLLAATFGYLLLEVGGNGDTETGRRLRRSTHVLALGFSHATGVVLVAVASAGSFITGTLADVRADQALLNLATITSASMALGVFLQVLWEDAPVTSPLSQFSHRSESR